MYLENRDDNLTQYILKVLLDKLLVKKPNSNKVKLELELESIAPFTDFYPTIMYIPPMTDGQFLTKEENKIAG